MTIRTSAELPKGNIMIELDGVDNKMGSDKMLLGHGMGSMVIVTAVTTVKSL